MKECFAASNSPSMLLSPLIWKEILTAEQMQYVANFPYRQIIGAILYVNVCSRPAISCSISMTSQFVEKPTLALTRLAQFVYNIRKDRLALGGGAELPHITAFSDSDWEVAWILEFQDLVRSS